jgi:hypothetical protein
MYSGYRLPPMLVPIRELTSNQETFPALWLDYAYAEDTNFIGGLIWGELCCRSSYVLDIRHLQMCFLEHLLAFEAFLQGAFVLWFYEK